jgi:TolA-binding protein
MRSFIFLSFSAALLSASEPSVFGAGDLNNPNPYGLTHEEKLILENKKEIQTVLQKSKAQTAKVETVTERLDGMQGILEGLSERSNEQALILQRLQDKLKVDENGSANIESLAVQVGANSESILQFKTLLGELSVIVDEINGNYVTKEQFAQIIKQLKINLPESSAPIGKIPDASLEKEAQKLFSQKKYTEAQRVYEQMVEKKIKTPEAYYMIGETFFERGVYKEAIAHYKQSASLNEKAFYMPTLLLHSGISMEKLGDKNTAKAFYQTALHKFSGTGAAKEAQERLSKIK